MGSFKDLTGMRFGRLVVLYMDKEKSHDGIIYWVCQCDCGNIKSIRSTDLTRTNNSVKSCGCLHKEAISSNNELYLFEEQGIGIGFFNGKHNNEFFTFDYEDVDCVRDRGWNKTKDGYARAAIKKYPTKNPNTEKLLHRQIMSKYEDISDKVIDHKSHNKIDERKSNLRSCTTSDNNINRKSPKNGSNTGYRNIHYHSSDGLFNFSIKIDKKDYHKSFKYLNDAIAYRDQFIIDHNLQEFYYDQSKDIRYDENYIGQYIDGDHEKLHPLYIVTGQYMAPPNSEDVISPFSIIDEEKFNK